MARVKEGLKDIKTLPLITKSRYIISQISANFTPPDYFDQVIAATDALAEANIAAYGKDHYRVAVKQHRQEELLYLLKQLASWVESVSNHSALTILKSGFEVRKGNAPLGMLPPPAQVRTIFTQMEGCILLRWKPVHGKATYLVETNNGNSLDESQWKMTATVSKTKAIIRNLESQKKY